MTIDRLMVRAVLRLVLLGGGAFAGYLLLSLFGGPAQAQPGDEDASLLGGVSTTVSTTVSTATNAVDDVSEPVDRVVEETARVDLDSPVGELTDQVEEQVEETVGTTLDTTGQMVEPTGEPATETAAPVVETPAVDETTGPLDPVVEAGDAPTGAAPETTSAPATVSQSGGDQPAEADAERESEAKTASDPAQPEPAAGVAGVALLRSSVPALDFDVIARAADQSPQLRYPAPVPARVPRPATGQAAAGAADSSPPSPTVPPETRLPDTGSGRTLLSEDVTGSGLVMPVSAPPG